MTGTDAARNDGDTDADTTNELLHRLAVGLTKVQIGLERVAEEVGAAARSGAERTEPLVEKGRERLREGAERARPAVARGIERGREATQKAREAARVGAGQAAETTGHVVDRARGLTVAWALRAEDAAEEAAENLRGMSADLANRARAARAAGVDFFDRHREEIIALIITAAKVAAVIGVRRLARPNADGKGGKRSRRVVDTMAVLGAVVTHVGELLARHPSALPLLREMYRKGNPSEQAIVGMLVGPALGSDPDHATDVVREFLEDATSEAAADTIARRTLTPLLRDNPQLLDKVLPWLNAASAYVQRAALIALARRVEDRDSRLGDIVAAAVVVLEDHDHEVREALGWLLHAASEIDMDEVARAVRDAIASMAPEARQRADQAMEALPEELRERIEAFDEEEGGT